MSDATEPARPAPSAPLPAAAPAPSEQAEKRALVKAGVAFFGALVLLIGVAAVFGGSGGDGTTATTTTFPCEPDDDACLAAQRDQGRPGIIPEPGSGSAPEEAGDRGGALQIALFGALVLGVGTIIALVVRSSRRARAAAASTSAPGSGAPPGPLSR